MRVLLILSLIASATPLAAQPGATPKPAVANHPVTIEYYYRIKWGKQGEFLKLYRKNHEPLLREMQKRGFITAMRMDEPYTHMAGGERWDLRVTITYRDGIAAVGDEPGGWDETSAEVEKTLYPDKAAHQAEESQRMGLLDEHWDVVVYEVKG